MGARMDHTPRRGRRLTQLEIEFIQRCEGSLRSVARKLRVGKSTVDYHRQKIYDRWSAEESDAEPEADTIPFQRVDTPRRCEVHGRVWFWPCVICSSSQPARYD
jgi:hypothetical protein